MTSAADRGRLADSDWLEFVADRIADYRERAIEFRYGLASCVTHEDHLRLMRDVDRVKSELLAKLGLREVQLSSVERELVNNVASVSQPVPGLPLVSGVWVGGRMLGKRRANLRQPFQRFLYQEFFEAWKRAGR